VIIFLLALSYSDQGFTNNSGSIEENTSLDPTVKQLQDATKTINEYLIDKKYKYDLEKKPLFYNPFIDFYNDTAKPILHEEPYPHKDTFYTSYKIDIPLNKVKALKKICHNISYDDTKSILTVHCKDIKANTVITWIVKKYTSNEINIDQASGMFAPMFKELTNDDPTDIKYHEILHEL
jgi:hypothetical protein